MLRSLGIHGIAEPGQRVIGVRGDRAVRDLDDQLGLHLGGVGLRDLMFERGGDENVCVQSQELFVGERLVIEPAFPNLWMATVVSLGTPPNSGSIASSRKRAPMAVVMLYWSIIHSMIIGFVETSGAGTSTSGPMKSAIASI